ncbi:MAG TPA: HD domain-containing protein [Gemmatales bacterium]|nr:HD domain-containing protein [Gemmatales bacterium]
MKDDKVTELFQILQERGNGMYFGEAVTELEHALQCAHFAVQARAEDSQVVAALLHDIGHLVHGFEEDIADRQIDGQHEEAGARWLTLYFKPAVTEPIRLHVAAKRYLCAVQPGYFASLSPASAQSLQLQGGPFSPAEQLAFEQQLYYRQAVELRLWDDQAKVPGMKVPSLVDYRCYLEKVLA